MSDDPATEATGSAENRDEPAMAGCAVGKVFCHGRQPACPPGRSEPSIPHEAERLHLSMLRRPCLSTLVSEQPGAPEGSIDRSEGGKKRRGGQGIHKVRGSA